MSFLEDKKDVVSRKTEGVARTAPLDIPGQGIGYGARWKASFWDAPEARIRAMQQSHPTAEFRNTSEGIAFRPRGEADFRLAEPSGLASMLTGMAADATGGGLPAEAGTLLGSLLGPAGAVLGGAGGEALQQGYQWMMDPSERSVMDAAGDVALSGAGAGLGEVIGAGGRALTRRNPPLSYDPAGTERRIAASREFDVPLTPAEVTKNRDLLVNQSWLHDAPRTGDVVDQFLEDRSVKIEDAVNRYLAELSPYGNPHRVDEYVSGEAAGLRRQMVDERRMDASPFYRQAAEDQADMTDVVEDLDLRLQDYGDTDPIARKLRRVRRMLFNQTEDGMEPISRVGTLHSVKMSLDDMIERAKRAGDNNLSRELYEVKENILGVLDDSSPAYRRAREEFANSSMPINEFDMSILGSAVPQEKGYLTGPTTRLSEKIFHKNSSPYEIQYARDLLAERNPDAWDAVVRSHMQRTFDELQQGMSTNVDNIGGQFRKAIFGSQRKRAQMRHALGPQRYERFERLMEVLEATGLGLKGQSQTQPRQALGAAIDRRATPMVGRLTSPYKWALGAMKEARLDQLYNGLVEMATKPTTDYDFAIDRAIREIQHYQGRAGSQRADMKATQALLNTMIQMGVQGAQ